ncbi:hypothetical protein ACJ4V0_15810 [Phreatobacter sp. HK31-P]
MSHDHVAMRKNPEFIRHYIKVLMREARARRGTRFHATLMEWIANGRRQLIAAKLAARPRQTDLFASFGEPSPTKGAAT